MPEPETKVSAAIACRLIYQ
jgi:hypothetical protein